MRALQVSSKHACHAYAWFKASLLQLQTGQHFTAVPTLGITTLALLLLLNLLFCVLLRHSLLQQICFQLSSS